MAQDGRGLQASVTVRWPRGSHRHQAGREVSRGAPASGPGSLEEVFPKAAPGRDTGADSPLAARGHQEGVLSSPWASRDTRRLTTGLGDTPSCQH